MTRRRPGAACALLLIVAAGGRAAAGEVAVDAPDGARDATARVACAEPESAPAEVDARGRAVVGDGCRRVTCTSSRWRAGAAILSAGGSGVCSLAPAFTLAVEVPQQVGGALVVSVRKVDERRPSFEATSIATPPARRAPVESAPLPFGRYEVLVARPDGSWTCRLPVRFAAPVRERLHVPWRDGVTVEGVVVSSAGPPIAGVPVVAVSPRQEPQRAGLPPARGRVEAWTCGPPETEVRSGLDGSFRLAVDPREDALIVAGGWTDPRGIDFVARHAGESRRVRLTPARPHRLVARVLDEDDRALPCRARVFVDDADESWAASALPGGATEAACAPDGRLEVGPFRAGAYELDLLSSEALPVRLAGTVPSGAGAVDVGTIRLDRGASMRVSIVDADRAPVAGASVVVMSRGGLLLERRAKSGADGVAGVAGLPREGLVDLTVEAAGFRKVDRTSIRPEGEIVVALDGSEPVTGTVVSEDGAPQKSRVHATTATGRPLAETETDDAGAFELSTLPAGPVRLQASAPGFRPSVAVGVTMEPGRAPAPVRLTLGAMARLRGTVLGPSRSPIAGAAVFLAAGSIVRDPPGAGALAATRAADDGGFTLDATGSPDETILAMAPGFAPASQRVSSIADPSAVELVLRPEARLVARVPRTLPPETVLIVADGAGTTRLIGVGGRSEVLVDGLAPGSGSVALGQGPGRPVRLTAGETATVDLSAGARVRVRVTGEGRPRPRVAVALAVDDATGVGTRDGALTDVSGAAEFEAVPPGPCLVVAESGDARAQTRIVVPGDGEIGVDLDLVVRALRVTVRERGNGAGVAQAEIVVTPRGGACTDFAQSMSMAEGAGWQVSVSRAGCTRGSTGTNGEAALTLPAAGPYVLSVRAAGFEPWTEALEVIDGGTDVLVELARGGPPIIRVAIETDPPGVPGSIYCVQPGHGGSRGPVAGEATCEGLAPGTAEVAFRAPDYGLARAAVEVPESGEAAVTLRVARGGTLVVPLSAAGAASIRVVDEHGLAWNNPYGLGWPRCGPEPAFASGPAYVCHEMPPGVYVVEVDGRPRAAVSVRGGDTAIAY